MTRCSKGVAKPIRSRRRQVLILAAIHRRRELCRRATRSEQERLSIESPDSSLCHTERSLCAILTAFLKNHKLDLLLNTFHSAPEDLQISPGITAHNIVLCTHGDVAGARKMLYEMEEKGMKPDLVSYNTLFTRYLKKGEESGFGDVLKEMVAKGLAPSVVTYNCRIGNLYGKKRTSEAEELLDAMASKGVRPNRGTFNAILDGFCKEGDVAAAMRVFKRMPGAKKEDGHDGASPNLDTYVLLIRSLVQKGEFMSGLEVFKDCLARIGRRFGREGFKGGMKKTGGNEKVKRRESLSGRKLTRFSFTTCNKARRK